MSKRQVSWIELGAVLVLAAACGGGEGGGDATAARDAARAEPGPDAGRPVEADAGVVVADASSDREPDAWTTDAGQTDAGPFDTEAPDVASVITGDAGARTADAAPAGPDAAQELFLDGFFPIGVFSQPMSSFDKWRSRGVNTLVQYEGRSGADSLDAWNAAATQRGMYMIRKPRPNPADDINERYLLAWAHRDEPDRNPDTFPASLFQADYRAWKMIDPRRPVFINFSGFTVMNAGPADNTKCNGPGDGVNEQCYPGYISAADWIGNDNYPVAGYNSDDLTLVGRTIDRLELWSGARPQFAFIESSDQDAPWLGANSRGVRPAELRAEIWEAIIHGARGIFYFPFKPFANFSWDGTPPDVVAEMVRQNALITSIAPVLQSRIDPEGMSVGVGVPLEGAWRRHGGERWYFVLNIENRERRGETVRLVGSETSTGAWVHGEERAEPLISGALIDDFAPHALHIYRTR